MNNAFSQLPKAQQRTAGVLLVITLQVFGRFLKAVDRAIPSLGEGGGRGLANYLDNRFKGYRAQIWL